MALVSVNTIGKGFIVITYYPEDCEQYVKYKATYGLLEKVLMFDIDVDGVHLNWHLSDITGKPFQHNFNRVKQGIEKTIENYPPLLPLMEKLKIFYCPRPSADTANACANADLVCFFARSTQIPWCMTDYVTTHELGHVVQFNLCEHHGYNKKFREYLGLRNAEKGECEVYDHYDEITKDNIYVMKSDFLYLEGTNEQKKKYSDWDMNPIEWFAEDFRWFFGTDQGDKYWGLPIPIPDVRIKEFMLGL